MTCYLPTSQPRFEHRRLALASALASTALHTLFDGWGWLDVAALGFTLAGTTTFTFFIIAIGAS